MMHGPEGQEQDYGDGVQPEDIQRIMESAPESNPGAAREALEGWEVREFRDKGNDPIDEEERFRLFS
jgi:hypothetical protein